MSLQTLCRIGATMSGSFMEPETYHGHIQCIRNTKEGDIFCPEEFAEYRSNAAAAEAYEVDPENVTTEFGWCVRMSAPGYLDCTDWAGPFETEQEGLDYLQEMYGDDEPAEDDEEETDKSADTWTMPER